MAEGDVADFTIDLPIRSSSDDDTSNESVESDQGIACAYPIFYIPCSKASEAIEFYKTIFGAEEIIRNLGHEDLLVSVDMKIGSDIVASMEFQSPTPDEEPFPGRKTCVFSEDMTGLVKKAIAAGAVLKTKIPEGADGRFDGPVTLLKDPFENVWLVGSPKEKKQVTDMAA
ncbi:hypothetical protein MKW94_010721 [Papaver nudicaule]|uniref:Glyoxalase At5g48480-like N-terminal domain-containing protein n=1 Tax=Papaver nudicaule TaxID=74823 RepID=A0AA41V0I9_PAPNU|nr:hypothetical protein [Papaver nudicaule]